jgi:hypothetical protein
MVSHQCYRSHQLAKSLRKALQVDYQCSRSTPSSAVPGAQRQNVLLNDHIDQFGAWQHSLMLDVRCLGREMAMRIPDDLISIVDRGFARHQRDLAVRSGYVRIVGWKSSSPACRWITHKIRRGAHPVNLEGLGQPRRHLCQHDLWPGNAAFVGMGGSALIRVYLTIAKE